MAYTTNEKLTKDARLFGTASYWNQGVKANLTALKTHMDAGTAVHGLNAFVLGFAQGAGRHIETVTSPWMVTAQIGTGSPGKPNAYMPALSYPWTFAKPFRTNPFVYVGVEVDGVSSGDGIWRRVAGVTTTGCELRCFVVNERRRVRLYGVAVGSSSDDAVVTPNQENWHPPRTWTDSDLFTYAQWNSEMVDDQEFLYRNHVGMSNAVHGLPDGVCPVGGAWSAYHMEAMRWPPGDINTQGYGEAASPGFTFANAFAGTPVCVTSAEFDADHDHDQSINTVSPSGVVASHHWPNRSVHWYVSILAIGND